jgi:hypothetical protein
LQIVLDQQDRHHKYDKFSLFSYTVNTYISIGHILYWHTYQEILFCTAIWQLLHNGCYITTVLTNTTYSDQKSLFLYEYLLSYTITWPLIKTTLNSRINSMACTGGRD